MLEKTTNYRVAKEAYARNENIIQKLTSLGVDKSVCIEIAYEIQAGSYTSAFSESEFGSKRNKVLHDIIRRYSDLDDVANVGVFGVGEAANWIGFDGVVKSFYGVELSYSRLRYARSNIAELNGIQKSTLIKGDASEVIFNSNSFDLTMTLHSIEPNGNVQGEKMLKNVINYSSRYIILFEPDYSTAPAPMKSRMEANGYVCNIQDVIDSDSSVSMVDKFLLDIQENKDNLTTCWILKKNTFEDSVDHKLVCPYSNNTLVDFEGSKYSSDSGLIYPVIDDILFINKQDAIFIGGNDLD